jgi:hypothetical protein
MMKVLAVLVVLVLGLAAAADVALKRLFEGAAATEVASALELEHAPEVSVEGWPFLPRFLQGELPRVEVDAGRADAGSVTLRRVSLELEDVAFDPVKVVRNDVDEVRISGGRGSLTLTEGEANRVLEAAGVPAQIVFSNGSATLRSDVGEATGDVGIADGGLAITSDLASTTVPLPSLGGRATYASVIVAEGWVRLGVDFPAGALRRPSD